MNYEKAFENILIILPFYFEKYYSLVKSRHFIMLYFYDNVIQNKTFIITKSWQDFIFI